MLSDDQIINPNSESYSNIALPRVSVAGRSSRQSVTTATNVLIIWFEAIIICQSNRLLVKERLELIHNIISSLKLVY